MIRRERARRSRFSLNPLIPRKNLVSPASHLFPSPHGRCRHVCVCVIRPCVIVLREGLRRRGRAAPPRETPFMAYQHGVPARSAALTGSGDGSATCSAAAAIAAAARSECCAAAVLNWRLICLSWSREEPAEEKFDEVLTLTPAVLFFFSPSSSFCSQGYEYLALLILAHNTPSFRNTLAGAKLNKNVDFSEVVDKAVGKKASYKCQFHAPEPFFQLGCTLELWRSFPVGL